MTSQTDPAVTKLVRTLQRLAPRKATHALVGPALIYGDTELVSCIVVRGIPGGAHRAASVGLGQHVPDPLDDPFTAHFGAVIHLTRQGEITMRQAREIRADFIGELKRGRLKVEAFETERELTDRYVRVFPGERSRRLQAAFEAERAA